LGGRLAGSAGGQPLTTYGSTMMKTQKLFRMGLFGCLLLLHSASGVQVPKPKLQTRAPNRVSQATSPVWVNEAPEAHASAALELWEVQCALWDSPNALQTEAGGKMLQRMIDEGWDDLQSVWKAETSAPELEALWKLCGLCPSSGTRADFYAFVKANYDVRCPALCPSLPSPLCVAPSSLPLPGSLRRQSTSITYWYPSAATSFTNRP
jgi:hypothetical protein